jgi:NTE family protein
MDGTADVLVVHINPLERAKLPTTAREIMNRINEISFNSSLMREMRAIAFVTKLIDDCKILDNSMKRMLIHGIEAADVMTEPGSLNKLNADWDNLTYLMKVGRTRADAWLQTDFVRLGEESTVDIREECL